LRLRIGIGHPGSADQVVEYVLRKPAKPDAELIQGAIDAARRELPGIVSGDLDLAMNQLHSSG
jgi:PTH1 family peptidyl-tRNA hydrolase